jgi:hypothetical protein
MTASRWLTERARRSRRTHHQGFAGADIAQQAREHGPIAIAAGGVFFEDGDAAGRA